MRLHYQQYIDPVWEESMHYPVHWLGPSKQQHASRWQTPGPFDPSWQSSCCSPSPSFPWSGSSCKCPWSGYHAADSVSSSKASHSPHRNQLLPWKLPSPQRASHMLESTWMIPLWRSETQHLWCWFWKGGTPWVECWARGRTCHHPHRLCTQHWEAGWGASAISR